MFVSLSICLSQRHLKTIEKLRDKKISSIYMYIYKNLSFVAITVVNKPKLHIEHEWTVSFVEHSETLKKVKK